jgi:hypothetical protein
LAQDLAVHYSSFDLLSNTLKRAVFVGRIMLGILIFYHCVKWAPRVLGKADRLPGPNFRQIGRKNRIWVTSRESQKLKVGSPPLGAPPLVTCKSCSLKNASSQVYEGMGTR